MHDETLKLRERMYWADKGKIFRILKNSLHESLFLAPRYYSNSSFQ